MFLMSKKQTDSFERLAKEYLSKCKCCDECFAESFCIEQQRREGRLPCKDKMKCVSNIYDYFHSICCTETNSIHKEIKNG